MREIKTDTINDTVSETNVKIGIVEEEEDVSELSMEKDEASEVTQLSCIVDKCSSVQHVAKQLDMLWNNVADLNRTMKNCRGIYEYNSHNVTSTIRNHCLHKHSFPFSSFQKYCEERKVLDWMSKSTVAKQRLHCYVYNQTEFNYEKVVDK
jgi:hypothetical protein